MTAAGRSPDLPDGRWDVVIAGGGPVGAFLALELGRRSIRTLLVDPELGNDINPRCNTISARTMELLRRHGLAAHLRQLGLPPGYATDVVHMTRPGGFEIARLQLPSRATVTGAGHFARWPTPEPVHRLSQSFMQPQLLRVLASHETVTATDAFQVDGFEQTPKDVQVTLSRPDGTTTTAEATFLAGCDGARSTIRRVLGVSLRGTDQPISQHVSVYFRSRALAAQLAAHPAWKIDYYASHCEGGLVAIDGTERFVFHATVPLDQPSSDGADSEALLRNVFGTEHDIQVLRTEHWYARRLVAERYSVNRVFLVGDAAHAWMPVGGFGMNTGVADAANLGWKLAASVAGWAGDALLDTYSVERQPVAELTSRAVEGWARSRLEILSKLDRAALDRDDEHGRATRERLGHELRDTEFGKWQALGLEFGYTYADSPVIARCAQEIETDDDPVQDYDDQLRPGARLPHRWMSDGRSSLDLVGDILTVLTCRAGSAATDQVSECRVPVDVVELAEADAGQLGLETSTAIVVRPDEHVSGISSVGSLPGLIDKARGSTTP